MLSFRVRAAAAAPRIFARACLATLALLSPFASSPRAVAQYSFVPASPQWNPAEILAWSPETDPNAPYNRSSVPLAERFTAPLATENAALNAAWNVNPHARPGEARVQAVTTFNTIPAGSPNGWRTTRLYAPSMWQYTDNMVFWGGSNRDTKTIVTPTAHMIDAAHRNGVRIYGKIFFGWNSSADNATLQKIRELLVKSGNAFPVADKLVEAAIYHGFDGYFINQENYQTNGTDAQNMRDFMAYFRTKAVAAGASHLRMVWYDAMAENGSRSFQNAFTNSNDGYMKSGSLVTQTGGTLAAHEMFLNFWWYYNSSAMADSRALALARGLDPYDIYAGIWTENYRVLGNTPDPNSSNNIAITWDYLFPGDQPHHLSLALFGAETPFVKGSTPAAVVAQDQIYWSGPNQDPTNTDATGTTTPNWNGIAHYIPANSAVTSLPFITNFNVGQGDLYKINGVSSMTGPWTNLSVQDILPTWRWIVRSTGAKTITPSLDFTEAYYGGSSLKLAGSLAANVPQEVKLYQTRLPVTTDTVLRLISKAGAVNSSQIQVGYSFEDTPEVMHYSNPATAASTAWATLDFPLGGHAGKTIALITVRVSSTSSIASYAANIGRLQISNANGTAPGAPSTLTLEGKGRNPDEAFSTQLKLKWTASAGPVLHYNLYYRKDLNSGTARTWLGATPNTCFFAQDVRRSGTENEGYVEVEAVSPDYAVSPSATTTLPTFTFESVPNLHHPVLASYPVQAPVTVIGSSSGGGNPAGNAFDNNTGTFTEPQADASGNRWVGLDLGAGNAKAITAIQFVPRNNWATRMVNGIFQGSNSADFSGAVQLAQVGGIAPQGIHTTLLVENPTAFRYLRYLSPGEGYANVAEIRFFTTGPAVAPSPPASFQGLATGSSVALTWNAASSPILYGYTLKKSTVNGGPYAIVATGLTGTTYTDTITSGQTCYYVLNAYNDAGAGADSDRLTINPAPGNKLGGTVIGGGTIYQTNTREKAFDGLLNTYFEVAADNGWVGLDLGSVNTPVITAIRYSPRNSSTGSVANANFMITGMFQVSNTPDFSSGVTTLFTIPSAPAYNQLTSVALPAAPAPWRYVRYRTGAGKNANISEFEIYGVSVPAAPAGVNLSGPGDGGVTVGWNAVPNATRYHVKRATGDGVFSIVGTVPTTFFQDSGLAAGTTYRYVVSAENEAGVGPESQEVITADGYDQWLLASGLPQGSAFDGDADGDGVPDGIAYMLPSGMKIGTADGKLSALLRQDAAVTARLWKSSTLAGSWTMAEIAPAADQSGVSPGFIRMEAQAVSSPGEERMFYRLSFAR